MQEFLTRKGFRQMAVSYVKLYKQFRVEIDGSFRVSICEDELSNYLTFTFTDENTTIQFLTKLDEAFSIL